MDIICFFILGFSFFAKHCRRIDHSDILWNWVVYWERLISNSKRILMCHCIMQQHPHSAWPLNFLLYGTGFTILSLMLKMNYKICIIHGSSCSEMLKPHNRMIFFGVFLSWCFLYICSIYSHWKPYSSINVLLTSVWAFYKVCENLWQCLRFLTTPLGISSNVMIPFNYS